jgi:hypothetical protein
MLSSNRPTDLREERGYYTVGGCGGNVDAWHVSTDTLDKAGEDELLRDIRLYAVSLLRVLNAEVLPFDHARNAAVIEDAIEEYDEAAGDHFSFEPTLEELRELREDIEAFQDAARAGDIDPKVANETITGLSRVLSRLNLVKDGQFEQDPAVNRDPVPRFAPAKKFQWLDEDDQRFLQVQLKREQNTVLAELRRARDRLPN